MDIVPSSARPSLPEPDAEAGAHSARVVAALRRQIEASGGWISFDAYMRFVLYAPGLGYYVAGARKFGVAGDFVTAPELTPLYSQALALQVAAIIERTKGDVLELGAGSGRLAADLLVALDARGQVPNRYRILEVSPALREWQRETVTRSVPRLAACVEWLETLPASIAGAVVLNEVLDAFPVHIVSRRGEHWFERGVRDTLAGLAFDERPLPDGALRGLAQARFPESADYTSEINLAAEALVEDSGSRLAAGAILAIDYGFPRHEYYHPQRVTGTLMGHYRHRAHTDPLLWPGLSDLTAHIDFTAIAEAGVRAGLAVAGFTTQASFLLGCGILDRLRDVGPPKSIEYMRDASAVQTLLSPAEMGELFKVLALARDEGIAWPGFAVADMRHRI